MDQFRVMAKIGGLISGDTPDAARSHAQKILTQLLEPKGFEVIGVAVVAGDKIPGRLATVETATDGGTGAVNVLKWLGKNVFAEGVRLATQRVKAVGGFKLRQYPLTVELGHPGSIDYIEAEGSVSEVPPDFYVSVAAKSPKIDVPDTGAPEVAPEVDPEIAPEVEPTAQAPSAPDTEHKMQIPAGEFGYGWNLKTIFDPETAAFSDKAEKRLSSEMERIIKLQLHGSPQKIAGRRSVSSQTVDNETGELTLVVRGLFTSPIEPEKLSHSLSEKIGIRSMLPKEVAETDLGAKPAATSVSEKNDVSGLLGSLFH